MEEHIPLVSIICLAYNHEPYIRKCLDGFVMQKTNFPIEVIIHDDASTDRTAQIIREYEEKYPHIIKPIYQTENQYQKGIKIGKTYLYPRATGKYIAECEGDDYWIDPLKLQKQVDFLDNHKDCSMCFHATLNCFTDHPERNFVKKLQSVPPSNKISLKEYICKEKGGLIATNSILYHKKFIQEIPRWMDEAPVGDFPLFLLLGSKGFIGYIDEAMGAYRRFSHNSWSSSIEKDKPKRRNHYKGLLKTWKNFDKWTSFKYHKEIDKLIKHIILKYYRREVKILAKRIFKLQIL